MIWFLDEGSSRLEQERHAIAELAEAVPWLQIVGWRLDPVGVRICLDADIFQSETVFFPVTLRYPEFFPNTPPSVLPRGELDRRWSEHQYVTADGRPGELCLEYGPDNWTSDLRGADLLASAHRLLIAEGGEGGGPVAPVLSRHETTLGQNLRSSLFRFVVTPTFAQFSRGLGSGALVPATVQSLSLQRTFTVVVRTGRPAGGPAWSDPTVPDNLGAAQEGVILRLDQDAGGGVFEAASFTALCAALGRAGIDLGAWVGAQESFPNFIVLAVGERLAARWRSGAAQNALLRFETIMAPNDAAARLSVCNGSLAGKKVALVGCGSAGSKISVSLARSGVGHFLLIDDDILLPGNLVRNDLDWREVGGHKANALFERIQLVNPAVTADVRRIRLSAHESSGTAAAALSAISDCDVIVDATADVTVFNLLSSVVASEAKPIVWLEIFGGGYGGLVARHRPGIDPDPQSMRAGVLDWCAQQDVTWPKPTGGYGADGGDGAPMVADDADVSVIAAHATRMVLDQLGGGEATQFPHSVYLVGLSEGWVFREPFETRPIDVAVNATSAGSSADPIETAAGLEFVNSLVRRLRDESADPE